MVIITLTSEVKGVLPVVRATQEAQRTGRHFRIHRMVRGCGGFYPPHPPLLKSGMDVWHGLPASGPITEFQWGSGYGTWPGPIQNMELNLQPVLGWIAEMLWIINLLRDPSSAKLLLYNGKARPDLNIPIMLNYWEKWFWTHLSTGEKTGEKL